MSWADKNQKINNRRGGGRLFKTQEYTQSPIAVGLKRQQIPSNLENLFMVVKTNTIRSQHLFFFSIEQFAVLIRRMFYVK